MFVVCVYILLRSLLLFVWRKSFNASNPIQPIQLHLMQFPDGSDEPSNAHSDRPIAPDSNRNGENEANGAQRESYSATKVLPQVPTLRSTRQTGVLRKNHKMGFLKLPSVQKIALIPVISKITAAADSPVPFVHMISPGQFQQQRIFKARVWMNQIQLQCNRS